MLKSVCPQWMESSTRLVAFPDATAVRGERVSALDGFYFPGPGKCGGSALVLWLVVTVVMEAEEGEKEDEGGTSPLVDICVLRGKAGDMAGGLVH